VLRPHLNRVLVAVTLLLGLPAMAVADRVRHGAGRWLGLRLSRALAWACGVRVEVAGGERLDPATSYVYVPNHRSHLDIVAMFLARPRTGFLAASEVARIPLLRSVMRAMDTAPIDRGDRRRAKAQLAALTERPGRLEIVVFAEGGIVLPDEPPRRFKTGAIQLAIDDGADLVPVAIHGAAEVAPPSRRLLVRPGTIRIELLAPVSTAGLDRTARKRVRDEVEAAVRAALA
jgi:1-acyl-sn-glycerol-3-phosphate acyltransferase